MNNTHENESPQEFHYEWHISFAVRREDSRLEFFTTVVTGPMPQLTADHLEKARSEVRARSEQDNDAIALYRTLGPFKVPRYWIAPSNHPHWN